MGDIGFEPNLEEDYEVPVAEPQVRILHVMFRIKAQKRFRKVLICAWRTQLSHSDVQIFWLPSIPGLDCVCCDN